MKLVKRSESPSMLSRWPSDLWNWFDNAFATSPGLMPSLDIEETDKDVVIRAELPGVEPKDVELFIRNNILTIRGEKCQESETREEGLYRAERRYGSFHREVPLPANVESGKVEATAHNGVLTVRLPKTEEATPRKIEVKTE